MGVGDPGRSDRSRRISRGLRRARGGGRNRLAAWPLTHLVTYAPSAGISDQRFHVYEAAGATHIGEPTDLTEADRIDWLPIDEVRRLLRAGEIIDGMTVTGLSYFLALSPTAA